jgi:hypothetical protein
MYIGPLSVESVFKGISIITSWLLLLHGAGRITASLQLPKGKCVAADTW